MNPENIQIKKSKNIGRNVLSGAINIAIDRAERHGTSLVIQEDGKIKHVSPEDMRTRLNQKN